MMIIFYLENNPNWKENLSASKPIFTTNSKDQIEKNPSVFFDWLCTSTELTKNLALHFHFASNTALLSRCWTGQDEHICWRKNKLQDKVGSKSIQKKLTFNIDTSSI
jgi:hypothetical protein